MGLAGSILWIVFGIAYIIYRFLRENPEGTISSILLVAIVAGAVIGLILLFQWLNTVSIILSGVVEEVALIGGAIWFFVWASKDKKKSRTPSAEVDNSNDSNLSE